MEKAWEKAVESARGGRDTKDVTTLTLDGFLKGTPCKLPAAALFEQFISLQVLSLANAGITSLEGFPCLPHLKRLILSDNRISGGLENLVQADLKNLQDLDLSNNRIQVLEDLVPLSQFNLTSLDLYECPVTRLPEYRARVFDIIKTLKFLDKMDAEGKERLESDEEGEEVETDDEEEEDVDNDERSNGAVSLSASGDQDDEEIDEEEEEDELDVEEEDEEYQDGVTINGHASAGAGLKPGHLAANAARGPSDDEVDDEDEDEAEVQDVDDEDEDEAEVQDVDDEDESDVAADDDDVAVDDDEEGTENPSGGAPGELDIQEDDEGEDEEDDDDDDDGEVGDEDEEDEGVENEGDEGEDEEGDYGTEYLVQPIAKAEDEDGGSDFLPADEDGAEEDEDIDDDDDDNDPPGPGNVGNHKRSRDEVDSDSSDDEDRNPKRR